MGDEKLQESSAQYEVLKVELENQKDKTADLESTKRSLEGEIKTLNLSVQKLTIQVRRLKQAADDSSEASKEDNNNEEHEDLLDEDSKMSLQKRIRDLQFRLLRMTTDMEEKDREKETLEKTNQELVTLVEEYEKVTEPSKAEEVRAKVKGQGQQEDKKKS